MAAVVKTPWDNRFVASGHSNSKIGVQNLSLIQGIDGKRRLRHGRPARSGGLSGSALRSQFNALALTMTRLNCGADSAKL
jgi:hypothetical protein